MLPRGLQPFVVLGKSLTALLPVMPGFPVTKMPNPLSKRPNLKLYSLFPKNLNAKQ